ncbi:hypothetical protein HMPREF1619_01941 [Klebsiella pneumoniae 909957]|nr:hypothetical protein HMPREF1619_01941 [Klebsiella pneumoniae 909957]
MFSIKGLKILTHRCRIVMFLFTAYGLLHLSSKRVFSSIKHKKSKTLFERIKTV